MHELGSFERKVGFDQIRNLVRNACLSDLGKQRTDKMHMLTSPEKIQALLNQTDEFRMVLMFHQDFPLDFFLDITPSLKKLLIEGTYLEASELFDLRRSQGTIRSILAFFRKKEDDEFPALKELCKDVKVYPYVTDSIDAILTRQGRIRDKASPLLAEIRRKLNEKSKKASNRLSTILKQAQSDGWVEQGINLAIRNGRSVIPVHSSFKRKIGGFVHDESASGKTVYIEPAEIVELNNEMKELEYAGNREIIRILTSLADSIRPYTSELFSTYEFLGQIDFIRAKALVARKLKGVKPMLIPESGMNWRKAIHPLLFLTSKPEGKEVVPLDIRLEKEKPILLVSGPNAGGKSVCLQTVGLLQYMFQCGMLVPALENSEFGVFKRLLIDIGDEQSIENDLSTYSSHLLNMKYFTRNSNNHTLILIDEFGTGTEPMLGGAIAEAILGKLIKNGTYGVLTTHYTNLKHFASSEDGVENGAMLFDRQNMQPLFQLEIGRPGSSFAFEIARKIGLSEEILQQATEKIGEDHVKIDKYLQEIVRDKKYWENKRSRIRKTEKKLEELVDKYSGELNNIKKLRKEIIDRADQEAKEILAGVNRTIENTIRKIKEANAEKEKTKQARMELEEMERIVARKKLKSDEMVERKLAQLRRKERQLKRPGNAPDDNGKEDLKITGKPDFDIGDKVKMTGQESVGEVIDKNDKSYLVSFGSIMTTLPGKKLEKISENDYRKSVRQTNQDPSTLWDLGKRRLNFSPRIDVRGQRTEEAIRMVMEFIDEAIVVESKTLWILHGKGDGILRQMIREYLNTVDIVKSFRDEHVDQGGSGITVVEIDV